MENPWKPDENPAKIHENRRSLGVPAMRKPAPNSWLAEEMPVRVCFEAVYPMISQARPESIQELQWHFWCFLFYILNVVSLLLYLYVYYVLIFFADKSCNKSLVSKTMYLCWCFSNDKGRQHLFLDGRQRMRKACVLKRCFGWQLSPSIECLYQWDTHWNIHGTLDIHGYRIMGPESWIWMTQRFGWMTLPLSFLCQP